MGSSHRFIAQSFVTSLLVLMFGVFCSSTFAVLGVPIANMKHAEKFEEAGKFARAAEERELAAEFYYWISVPQYKEYLAYYEARGDTGQVAECEKWLRDFDEWIATCREKAKEDWAQVDATPELREKSRKRIETRMIASADLYPMMHHDMLNIKLLPLERNAKYPEEFEIIAESRERTARLYEAMGVRYCQHAAEMWDKEGKQKDALYLQEQVKRYEEIIEHNRRLAQEARQNMAAASQWNDVAYLQGLLHDDSAEMDMDALERLGSLGEWRTVRQALQRTTQAENRERVIRWLKEKNDIAGLLWAESQIESAREPVHAILSEMPLTVDAMRVPMLLDALAANSIFGQRDEKVATFALNELAESLSVENATEQAMLERSISRAKPGLQGIYYTGKEFDKEHSLRVDASIDFEWTDAPMEGMPDNIFSARWVGGLKVPESIKYELLVESDDGVRLWLDGQSIADDWRGHAATRHGKLLQLDAGYHPIVIEYYNNKNEGVLRLLWKQDGKAVPVPDTWLWHIE